MRFSRSKFQATVLSAVVGLAFAAGCSDDDDADPGTGGSAGTGGSSAGTAGKSTGGSSSGTGGKGDGGSVSGSSSGGSKAGSSGSAGTAGDAGGDAGGSGGDAGQGGGGTDSGGAGAGGMGGETDPGCGALLECGDTCVDSTTSTANCGACARACLTDAATTATACAASVCNGTCAAGFLDCTHPAAPTADNGCETALTLPTSCGTSCGDVRACTVDEVCSTGCKPQGIVKFFMPFTAAAQVQRYADVHMPTDMTNYSFTIRAYAPGATSGTISFFGTDNTQNTFGPATTVNLSTLAAGWVDVVMPAAVLGGEYNPATLRQITIDVTSGAAGDVNIYIDRVTTSAGAAAWSDLFPTAVTPMVKSGATGIPNSTLTWLNLLP